MKEFFKKYWGYVTAAIYSVIFGFFVLIDIYPDSWWAGTKEFFNSTFFQSVLIGGTIISSVILFRREERKKIENAVRPVLVELSIDRDHLQNWTNRNFIGGIFNITAAQEIEFRSGMICNHIQSGYILNANWASDRSHERYLTGATIRKFRALDASIKHLKRSLPIGNNNITVHHQRFLNDIKNTIQIFDEAIILIEKELQKLG